MNWFYENIMQETNAGYQTRSATAWGYSDADVAEGLTKGMQSGDLLDGWDVPEDIRQDLAENGGMVQWREVVDTETWEGFEEVCICKWVGGNDLFEEVLLIQVDVQR